jgi:D-aminopeptidase
VARTGVTILVPHQGDLWNERPSAGFFMLNGSGVVCGSDWINESGALEGPIALTNSHSVGDVASALIRIMVEQHSQIGGVEDSYLPVVAECDDSPLNDINAFHVKETHVRQALRDASPRVLEGAIGAGTGMTCYGFKGGIGTASRVVTVKETNYTLGVLVNTNHGQQHQLIVGGIPVGRYLAQEQKMQKNKEGSIVIVLATDAPMNQRQLERVARRACLGLARTGAIAAHGSGDFAIAISLGRKVPRYSSDAEIKLPEMHQDSLALFFEASVEATEEAILNSIFMAQTVTGRGGHVSPALPVERCLEIMKNHKPLESAEQLSLNRNSTGP